jgi:hypothetical protein
LGSTLKRKLLKIKVVQNRLSFSRRSQILWNQNYSNNLINNLMYKPYKEDFVGEETPPAVNL